MRRREGGCGRELVVHGSTGGGSSAPAKACGTVNIAVNPWVGYEADAAVVGYLLKTKLGCNVVDKKLTEQVSWQGFATGEVDAVLENWGHPDLVAKYITTRTRSPRTSARPATRGSSAGTSRSGWPTSTRTSPTTRT